MVDDSKKLGPDEITQPRNERPEPSHSQLYDLITRMHLENVARQDALEKKLDEHQRLIRRALETMSNGVNTISGQQVANHEALGRLESRVKAIEDRFSNGASPAE